MLDAERVNCKCTNVSNQIFRYKSVQVDFICSFKHVQNNVEKIDFCFEKYTKPQHGPHMIRAVDL